MGLKGDVPPSLPTWKQLGKVGAKEIGKTPTRLTWRKSGKVTIDRLLWLVDAAGLEADALRTGQSHPTGEHYGCRGVSMARTITRKKHVVVCVRDTGYPAALEVRKIYQALGGAEVHDLVGVIDESGEDHLFPAKSLIPLEIPKGVKTALRRAAGQASRWRSVRRCKTLRSKSGGLAGIFTGKQRRWPFLTE